MRDADARGSEGLYEGERLVGRATSGGFGFRTNKSLALGLVEIGSGVAGAVLEIVILGERYPATVIEDSPYDPSNERLRA